MDQEMFLARVRGAAHAGRAFRVTTREVPTDVGYSGVSGDLCARFAEEVIAVGGEAEIVADAAGARQALARLLSKYAIRSTLVWDHDPVLQAIGAEQLLTASGVNLDSYASLSQLSEPEQRQRIIAADLGLTSCALAIAETGTLVMRSGPGRERVASLVPPVHIAVVTAAQIVPDLLDVFAQLNGKELPSNMTLITGPSKTGDIELQLTTGVHGPKHWHVVVVRNP